jgi:hypothetical protein
LKILAHALAQIERLADVDDRAKPVAMQIHTGLVRHGAQFFADGITDWHGNNLQRKSIFGDEELFLPQRHRIFNHGWTQLNTDLKRSAAVSQTSRSNLDAAAADAPRTAALRNFFYSDF